MRTMAAVVFPAPFPSPPRPHQASPAPGLGVPRAPRGRSVREAQPSLRAGAIPNRKTAAGTEKAYVG